MPPPERQTNNICVMREKGGQNRLRSLQRLDIHHNEKQERERRDGQEFPEKFAGNGERPFENGDNLVPLTNALRVP